MAIPRVESQRMSISALALFAAVSLSVFAAHGQSNESRFSTDDLHVRVAQADQDAASSVVSVYRHANYARTPAGFAARSQAGKTRIAAMASSEEVVGNDFTQYPAGVANPGGMVVQQAVSHAVYLNPGGACTIESCWGNPEGFLHDLSHSDFIHVVDEYVGEAADRRYKEGARRTVLTDALPSNSLPESYLWAVLHNIVSKTGEAGYGNIYHLFLPPGIDTCWAPPGASYCYSPDNWATFYFCAYHDDVTFTDLGVNVIFTVEPWQGAQGCLGSPTGAPNGPLTDSTDTALAHELMETISDPEGDAWRNYASGYLLNTEIADECLFNDGGDYWVDPTFRINGNLYRVQSIYSNRKHACVIAPQDY